MPLLPAIVLFMALGEPATTLADFRTAILNAKPGDRITLAPGTYEGSLFLEHIRGEKDKPITIAGADPANPPTIRGRSECLHFAAPAYITIEHLRLTSASDNGLNIDDAGELTHPAPGVTLRHLTVTDIGAQGNHDGIKLSGLTEFLIEHCTVEHWSDGGSAIDMVGCTDGTIRDSAFRNTDTGGASGIQLKGGTKNVTVRACRFDHAGRRAVNIGGSTGLAFFRPRPLGFEAAAITVEGCSFTGSEAAIAFVGVDGATVRFNTIDTPARWPLRILQETRAPGFVPCRRGVITDNLIIYNATAINIGDATDAPSFTFARNVWWNPTNPAPPALPSPETNGTYGKNPHFTDPTTFHPDPANPAAKAGAHAFPAT
ncbi:MAG: right-handed parallel beta-helix repeat-containing protein [Planctomycetes bacterium]|nr:right-handed parallel beta-helix repeat-containing protein [Planctomycetota bacterium]